MKNITILLLLALLLLSACSERGYTIQPIETKTPKVPVQIVEEKKALKQEPIEIKTPIKVKTSIVKPERTTPLPDNKKKVKEVNIETFFTFSEETKKNLSGLFIIAIGILILL